MGESTNGDLQGPKVIQGYQALMAMILQVVTCISIYQIQPKLYISYTDIKYNWYIVIHGIDVTDIYMVNICIR